MGRHNFLLALFVVTLMGLCHLSQAKKNTNRQLVVDVDDVKDFKKLLRTRNNVLVLFAKKAKDASKKMDLFSNVAAEMKGLATLAFVDCSDAKKLCKKYKVDLKSKDLVFQHFQEGEFNKLYDRQDTLKSMVSFLKDPTGEVPWDEEVEAQDVVHLLSSKQLDKLLKKEKKPILTMFYAPWCGHCTKLKPDFALAAAVLKGEAVLAGMDVDKPENYETRTSFNITGFPTLIYFEKGKQKYDYGGERNKDGIIDWMRDPQPPKEPEKEAEWSDEETDVVHLNDDTFESYLADHNSVLVMFYAPWCGHCKKMKPEYADAAAQLKEEGFEGVLAAVDATKAERLGKEWEVKGFPTLKYFKDAEFAWNLNERTADKFVEHLRDPQEPPPPPPPEPSWSETESEVNHLKTDTFKTHLKKKKHALVMFYAPWCGHCKAAKPFYQAAAEKFKDDTKVSYAAIDCTEEKDICSEFGVSGYPTIKYFSYGKDPEDFNGGRDEDGFSRFIAEKAGIDLPKPEVKPEDDFWLQLDGGENVKQLLDSDFDDFIAAESSVLVMFYAPWCGHCKNMKPDYSEAATRLLEMEKPGVFAAIDGTTETKLTQKYEVKGFPKLKYFKDGKFQDDYTGGRTTEDLLTFMTDPASATKPTPAPPAPAKWSDEPSEVQHLTADNFDPFTKANGHVLVMFYAPWCGHCKAAKPKYQAAAEEIKDLPGKKFAAMDCTEFSDLCKQYDVKGYPTFKLFKDGENLEDYRQGREQDQFVAYMKSLGAEETDSTAKTTEHEHTDL